MEKKKERRPSGDHAAEGKKERRRFLPGGGVAGWGGGPVFGQKNKKGEDLCGLEKEKSTGKRRGNKAMYSSAAKRRGRRKGGLRINLTH